MNSVRRAPEALEDLPGSEGRVVQVVRMLVAEAKLDPEARRPMTATRRLPSQAALAAMDRARPCHPSLPRSTLTATALLMPRKSPMPRHH